MSANNSEQKRSFLDKNSIEIDGTTYMRVDNALKELLSDLVNKITPEHKTILLEEVSNK